MWEKRSEIPEWQTDYMKELKWDKLEPGSFIFVSCIFCAFLSVSLI